MNLMYLIIGRSGSGKTHLVKSLLERDFKIVKTYTTRPKRYESEDTYHFIDGDTSKYNKVAPAVINNYEYFATEEEIENKNLFVIDPQGAVQIANHMPDTTFIIYYISADKDVRKMRTSKRHNASFEERDESEDEQFTEFESHFDTDFAHLPHNIYSVTKLENDYMPGTAQDWAKQMHDDYKIINKLTEMIKDIMPDLFYKLSDDGKRACVQYTTGPVFETPEHLALTAMHDDEFAGMLLRAWALKHSES